MGTAMDHSKGNIFNLIVISVLLSGVFYLCIWPPSPSFFSNPIFPFQNCRCKEAAHIKTTMSISSPKDELTAALERASMGNKTVIIAIVNKAYVEGEQSPQKSMFDLFLESFWLGEGTQGLLDHLLVVAVDQVAYKRCNFLRLHCYRLVTEGVDFTGEEFYMSKDFIKMMWKRTQFLGNVLKRGYNFIFTDTDVMWLRNPFLKLVQNDTYDLQISCDFFHGNPRSEAHQINTGLYYIRSSNKTIALFELWHAMKSNYPGVKEQDVLIKLMHRGVFRELGLRLKVMDTLYFSGFCEDSRDLRAVTTVHANCCRGLNAKIADVVNVLQDWRKFKNSANHTLAFSWSQHNACIHSW